MSPETNPTFIDFEASSLDLVASYPIEVGVCTGGDVTSWLIRPHVLWHDWSESAQRVHGIDRQTLLDSGLELDQVTRELDRLLPAVVYCDAWTFDSFWLHRLFKPTGQTPGFQLEPVSTLLTPAQCAAWAEARLSVIADLGMTTHRAGSDALILHETWKRIIGCDGSGSG